MGASFLGDLIGGIIGNNATDKAADSMVDATKDSNKTLLEAQRIANQITEPNRFAGLNALAMQGSLLGNPNLVPQDSVANARMATAGPTQFNSYATANPDVDAAWNNPQVQRQFGGDKNAFLKWHYENIGQGEGRQIPGVTSGGTGQGQVGVGPTVDGAYDMFNNSGFAKSMLETTGADMDRMVGHFGAAGNALSGSAIGALNDRNRSNTATAFNNYYNALSGISGTGAQLSSQASQNALNTGNNIASNQQQIGNIRGSSYLTQGDNNVNTLNNGIDTAAYFFGKRK